jgi:ERCC4-type nuclease
MSVYINKENKDRKISLPFKLIVDTREQKPLWKTSCERLCLKVGDYSTVKLVKKFAVERKSPGDLYGTITKGHERFKREIKRAIDLNIKLVVFVECSKKKFIAKEWPGGFRRKFPSTGLERIINTLSIRYSLEFIWCNNRAVMKRKVIKRLKQEECKK